MQRNSRNELQNPNLFIISSKLSQYFLVFFMFIFFSNMAIRPHLYIIFSEINKYVQLLHLGM